MQRDKCDQYWPNINTSQTCGDVTVVCSREEIYAEFTHRTFTAEKVHVLYRLQEDSNVNVFYKIPPTASLYSCFVLWDHGLCADYI